jgi:hypothetical protein
MSFTPEKSPESKLGTLFKSLAVAGLLSATLLSTTLLSGCVEETVSSSGGWGNSGLKPRPVEFEKPPEKEDPIDWMYPFEVVGDGIMWVGRGIGSLFDWGGDSGSDKAMVMKTPDGKTISIPKDYSGSRSFTSDDGKPYRLIFDKGKLIGIENGDGTPVRKPQPVQPAPQN